MASENVENGHRKRSSRPASASSSTKGQQWGPMLVGVGRLRCARILITAAPVRPFASLLAVLG